MPKSPRRVIRSRSIKRLSHIVKKPQPPARSNIRRVFRKSASQEAHVYLIRTGKRKRVFFRAGYDSLPTIRKYILHKIFYALYPQYAIKPIGLVVATLNGEQVLGMTSDIVRPRSHDYKLYHHTFYNDPAVTVSFPHMDFSHAQQRVIEQIKKESGISVNDRPVNIIDSNGKPIFVEVEDVRVHNRATLTRALHEKKVDLNSLKSDILKNTPPDKRSLVSYIMETII
ncbi:MAG: hypothetical protein FJY86_03635 [Candidatus Diapherotrites archaeon]|uniref:Uncharacterized protein n=1 Tax=Candidatus Iainarchaeum sp. TaxID=3101447 RepID=A0A8T4C749_9ARCH|nr:hypothetical protein [Candidatus Diapherotrites archaeon]